MKKIHFILFKNSQEKPKKMTENLWGELGGSPSVVYLSLIPVLRPEMERAGANYPGYLSGG